MSLVIAGATIIDGVAHKPIEGKSIWVEGGRIKAIAGPDELAALPITKVIDARGKFVIAGLINANVHLLCDISLENLVRHMDRYEELITEAAQITLKSGLTTVFDTWGPRRFLMAVRDRINAGEVAGSRIFCAGNIVGFDGPFSPDFHPHAMEVATAALTKRINSIWVENVGRHLMWLPPDQVARHVRDYIGKGINFIKFASNEHYGATAGAFLAFSPQVQSVMVEEAHRAGITAQAHTMSVEGLRIAIQAGCDLIQHANITGPVAIPEATLELMAKRKTGAVVFPWTKRGLDWIMKTLPDTQRTMWRASDTNACNLIRSGAPILLANDGYIVAPERMADPSWIKSWAGAPEEDSLAPLGTGHFFWFKAMEEKGCPPMEMLKAATLNIAVAYGKDNDLGTVEPGKIADLLILDKNPLQAAQNYRSIHMILQEGVIVDRDTLPRNPILTKPMAPPPEEEACYVPSLVSSVTFPMCPTCMCR
jgi:imidazolonepropionase-like amidohydrolase